MTAADMVVDASWVATLSNTEVPLEIGERAPGPWAQKMELGRNVYGLLEGKHTGGPYVNEKHTLVYKPLDVLPYPNAEKRYISQEVQALLELEGLPGFPRCWWVERHNERLWLVRYYSRMVTSLDCSHNQIRTVNKAIILAFRRGWLINDPITTAIDPSGNLFIVDLSNASRAQPNWHNDDLHTLRRQWLQWLEIGFPERVEQIKAIHHEHHTAKCARWLGITPVEYQYAMDYAYKSNGGQQ